MNKIGMSGMKALLCVLALGVSVTACADKGEQWKEEVLLHDGQKIVVQRSVEFGGRHEPGQRPPYSEQILKFKMPKTGKEVVWKDTFSKELGTANFLPKGIDIFGNKVYLVVAPMGCLSYNKWGRPNPPYVIFRHEGETWKQATLADLPPEFKTMNLITSAPDWEVKKSGKKLFSAEDIKEINSEGRPEFKSIVREPIKGTGDECAEMVSDGAGKWVGIGWFRRQANMEACVLYCDTEGFKAERCPCKEIFKGK